MNRLGVSYCVQDTTHIPDLILNVDVCEMILAKKKKRSGDLAVRYIILSNVCSFLQTVKRCWPKNLQKNPAKDICEMESAFSAPTVDLPIFLVNSLRT